MFFVLPLCLWREAEGTSTYNLALPKGRLSAVVNAAKISGYLVTVERSAGEISHKARDP